MSETRTGSPSAALPVGDIQMYDNYLPALEAGEYQITALQEIPGLDTGGYFEPLVQDFEVRAPQFSLDASDIGEMYPPPNSNGIYGSVLPTIVLNQRVLPWERLIKPGEPPEIPWLALLTFDLSDIIPDPDTNATFRSSSVSALLAPVQGIEKPQIDPQNVPDDVLASTVQSIVVERDLFKRIAPRRDELKYLAHVRETDTGSQAISDAAEDGWYAVVVSNRFPNSSITQLGEGTKNVCCLVSLEGLTNMIGSDDEQEAAAPADIHGVQVAVLANWSFVSNPEASENFAQLMENFVSEEGSNPANLLPRIPIAEASSAAATRINQGYVPFVYHTAVGEETFAWYRGPFAPVVAQPLPAPGGNQYTSSAALTIYLETQGLFDLSYAAAFEMGRAIALSDRGFATALINARRQVYRRLNTIADRLAQARFADMPLAQLLEPNLMRKHFATLLNKGMGDALVSSFARFPSLGANSNAAPQPVLPGDPISETRQLLEREDVQTLIATYVAEEMDPIAEWLAHLSLLYNVPFNQLIADQRMLPVESVRFFYIDQGWLTALNDGALSVGVESSRDILLGQVWREPLQQAVRRSVGQVRAKRRRKESLSVDTSGDSFPIQSGMIIRSAAISGWPGLVVKADNGATAILRMDILADNVLLVLFGGIPQTVTISEPWHGLRFGVEDGDVIQLRAPDGKPLHKTFPASGTFAQFFRPPNNDGAGERVLEISKVVSELEKALGGQKLGSALFATEMVQAPERLAFNPAPTEEVISVR